jgi:predicted esterase
MGCHPVAGRGAGPKDASSLVATTKSGAGRAAAALVAVALLAAVLAAAIGAGSAAAAPAPANAGLVVTGGSYKVVAGRLVGSATVDDSASKATGNWHASLVAALPRGEKLLRRSKERALQAGQSRTLPLAAKLPEGLPAGRLPVWFCARHQIALAELTKADGCRAVGAIVVPGSGPKAPASPGGGGSKPSSPPAAPGSPSAPGTPETTPPAKAPIPQIPTAPLSFTPEVPFQVSDPGGFYWADVPAGYDSSNRTETELFVWMHGCGGESGGDIYTVSPETVGEAATPRNWISISIGGRDGECWDPNTDVPLVFAALEDAETHFNIDRHRVFIGGYSSGGDLAYRTAFYNSSLFAGLLAENTAPFRDTGSTAAASLAAATTKFHVVHLAHLQDDEYPIGQVRGEIAQVEAAGFPTELIEEYGDHYNEPEEIVDGHLVGGTDNDLIFFLLPHLEDGWRSP